MWKKGLNQPFCTEENRLISCKASWKKNSCWNFNFNHLMGFSIFNKSWRIRWSRFLIKRNYYFILDFLKDKHYLHSKQCQHFCSSLSHSTCQCRFCLHMITTRLQFTSAALSSLRRLKLCHFLFDCVRHLPCQHHFVNVSHYDGIVSHSIIRGSSLAAYSNWKTRRRCDKSMWIWSRLMMEADLGERFASA